MTFIFENQKSKFHTQCEVTAWATEQLTDWCFLYTNAEGNDMKVSHYYGNIFYFADFIYDRNGVSGAILGTFSAHLMAAQSAKQIPDIEFNGVKPAFPQAYSALVLSAARVSLFITFLVC